jgi:hypothetical protein
MDNLRQNNLVVADDGNHYCITRYEAETLRILRILWWDHTSSCNRVCWNMDWDTVMWNMKRQPANVWLGGGK